MPRARYVGLLGRLQTRVLRLPDTGVEEGTRNVPTVSDTPSAGDSIAHQNDFGKANRVCVMLSGGHCVSPYADKYKDCTVRCWAAMVRAALMARVGTRRPAGRLHDEYVTQRR